MVSVQDRHKAYGDGDQESNEVAKNTISCGGSISSIVEGKLKVTKLRGTTTELASKRHALSERKRRKRINCHYDSLRQFFPRLLKNDKASVLSETVRRLKELKKLVDDVELSHCIGEENPSEGSERSFFIPSENDEMTVSYAAGGNKTAVRAIICCEDRPGLNQDLTEAIQSAGGKPVKAIMSTVGGRTKAEVMVEWPECGGGREEGVGLLKRALKAVVKNRVLGRTGLQSHGYTEPEYFEFGPRFVEGERPKVCDQFENGLPNGLIVKSY